MSRTEKLMLALALNLIWIGDLLHHRRGAPPPRSTPAAATGAQPIPGGVMPGH